MGWRVSPKVKTLLENVINHIQLLFSTFIAAHRVAPEPQKGE